jgi:DNA uptake protein ComE-like DNA-binding protein
LNLKIAKEIVKARPFTSLADLSRVRSLGDSALKSLKGFLTL